jgi:hypothetical protein
MDDYNKYLRQIEKKEKKSLKRLLILLSIPVILAIVLIFYSIESIGEVNQKNVELEMRNERVRKNVATTLHEIEDELAHLQKDTSKIKQDTILRKDIQKVKNKIHKLSRIVEVRNPTIVRYYKRSADDPAISRHIQDLGFDLNIRPVDSNSGPNKVNTIWFGDSVNLGDVEILAEEFLTTSNELYDIKAFEKADGYEWKNKSIEIGFERNLTSNVPLTNQTLKLKIIELSNSQ